MKVILKQDVKSLGKTGDMVNVSDGYGRNYLIPKGLALEASTRNVKEFEHQKTVIGNQAEKARKDAEALAGRLKETSVTVTRKVGEQDKLFGSVTAKDIEELLVQQGIEIDRKKIVLDEPIKSLGAFPVKIKLSSQVTGEIVVNVAAE